MLLTCEGCDAALKSDVAFIEYVTQRDLATVEVIVTANATEGDLRSWGLAFTGRGPFADQNRQLRLSLPATATAEEVRAGIARVFKFGLAEYAMQSDAHAPHLDVAFTAPTAPGQEPAGAAAARAKDPWNYWVFRVSGSGDRYGEQTQSSQYFSSSASANRTTEAWKIRLSGYRSSSTSRFDVDETLTIRTKQSDWSVDSLVVKSLGPHWSAGVTGAVSASTYSNQKLTATINPAVEFDVFPYAESSQRSLTVQYALGLSRYKYREVTIFDKLEETMPRHSLTTSLGLRQPWGSVGAGSTFSQSLSTPSLNRISISGNVSIRLFRGFTLNSSGSFSRIRDQFYLEKSDATEEEVLLRLRQLATGHRYSMSFGFSYNFGSLSNATVNPRFGG